MAFKAIFFDMDGLLVDTESIYFDTVKEVLASVNVEITKDWYIHENLGKGRSSLDLATEAGIPHDEVEILRKRRNALYGEMLKGKVSPIDGVVEVLERLEGHFLLAIVTSSRREHFDIIMEKTGLLHFFDFFLTGADVTRIKPDPEPYLKAIERAHQQKKHCLVLEDSFKGTQAAKAAGLTCYAIPDALTRTHNFSIADKVLRSIRELPDLVL
jgi:HAD superfamily hydrolase (TIGR01509 family)